MWKEEDWHKIKIKFAQYVTRNLEQHTLQRFLAGTSFIQSASPTTLTMEEQIAHYAELAWFDNKILNLSIPGLGLGGVVIATTSMLLF